MGRSGPQVNRSLDQPLEFVPTLRPGQVIPLAGAGAASGAGKGVQASGDARWEPVDEGDGPLGSSSRILDYLQREYITTREQVEDALRGQEAPVALKLGEVLLSEQRISPIQLEHALALQASNPGFHVGAILIQTGAIDEAAMRRALVRKLGIPFVDLRRFQLEPVGLGPRHHEFMRKHQIVPLFRVGPRMVVAVENPLATGPLQELAFCTRLRIESVMASADDIDYVARQSLPGMDSREKLVALVSELNGQQPAATSAPQAAPLAHSDNAVVRLVNMIIMDAHAQGASDIHIETMKGDKPIRIRFRKDGVLLPYSEIPAAFRDALVSRIKIMSQLDISEKRHAQDGKVHFERFGPARIELRVVTIPTVDGLEDIVMRILANRKLVLPEELGLAPAVLAALEKLVLKPQGLLFVCGPTGSGKTTTLHALMSRINTPERKIWTVEDPVEITQDGLRQVQVQSRIDWTFAAVLRSFMRADPDVIMVGETRDLETARTVLEASLTGHLVLSTMHTNSAAESMVRLLDFGLDPFNFSDALIGVLSQRLVRRLCASCSRPYRANAQELGMLAQEYCENTGQEPAPVQAAWRARYGDSEGHVTLRAACGCEHCDGSGYKGRLGIHELLVATPAIKKQIAAKVSAAELARGAMAQGMRTLRQDGIEKILQGQTSWEQVRTL
jgi:type II secretory ATPase GspE/PulE/Tfp pilus assembly ATPase PilB-like protein